MDDFLRYLLIASEEQKQKDMHDWHELMKNIKKARKNINRAERNITVVEVTSGNNEKSCFAVMLWGDFVTMAMNKYIRCCDKFDDKGDVSKCPQDCPALKNRVEYHNKITEFEQLKKQRAQFWRDRFARIK